MTENSLTKIIFDKIYIIKNKKVMLDHDLADLYSVETKQLKRQVRRNIERFPDDFMFELSEDDFANLRCQIGTSSWGGSRYRPMAFTEQGIAMLSSVLNSKIAIIVNIDIMRAFVKMREVMLMNDKIHLELEKLKSKVDKHDEELEIVINTIEKMLSIKDEPIKKIGF